MLLDQKSGDCSWYTDSRGRHEETLRVFRWDFRIVLHRSCGAATPEAFPSCTARYSDTAYRVLSFPSPDASVIERTKKHPTRIQHKNKAPHRASPPWSRLNGQLRDTILWNMRRVGRVLTEGTRHGSSEPTITRRAFGKATVARRDLGRSASL